MKVYTPKDLFPEDDSVKIFLAGSIGMGVAEPWQDNLIKELESTNITIFNPRWVGFDPTEEQSTSNPKFRAQVEWELAALTSSDIICMYFDPNTKSPISLLELGLFHKKPIVVCCPDGFWRQGNIQIVCEWYGVQYTNDKQLFFDRFIALCKTL